MSRVLIFANNDVGLYKFRKELLDELIKLENQVFIALPPGNFISSMKELGCNYIATDIDRRGMNPFKDIKLILNYTNIIKSVKPDVVLTYTIKPNIYGGFLCGIKKIPYIINITGLGTAIENTSIMQKLIIRLYKIGVKNASCIFFQNIENKKFFQKFINIKNSQVLPGSGVNLSEYSYKPYPENDTNIKIIYVGRIMKDKGINELFEAIKIIKKEYGNVNFELIGDTEENYTEQLNELEKNNLIKYYGVQKDVRPFINNCHAIILPSYHEGMANVLLESAATGRPVLASQVPGCIETFDEEISGFGFRVKDVNSIVETIRKFIELPYEQKKGMGLAGRLKMEQEFNRRIIIDAYLEEIAKAITK